MKYRLVYYLRNQSRVFSESQVYETDDIQDLKDAIEIAKVNGYEIVDIVGDK